MKYLAAVVVAIALSTTRLHAQIANPNETDQRVHMGEEKLLQEAGETSAAERANIHERAELLIRDEDVQAHEAHEAQARREAQERIAREAHEHEHHAGNREPQGHADHADPADKPSHEPHFHEGKN